MDEKPENWCKPKEHEFAFGTPTEEEFKEIPELIHAITCKKCPLRIITYGKMSEKDLEWAKQEMERSGYI